MGANLPAALPLVPYLASVGLIKTLTIYLQEYENKKGIKF